MGPGLVIPACGSTTATIADDEAAQTKGQELAVSAAIDAAAFLDPSMPLAEAFAARA